MQGLYFVYLYTIYCYIFLMLYICIFYEMSLCEPESQDFILFDKTMVNTIYLPVYMKVNYLLTLCLFKVRRLFCKLAIPNNICVFVICPRKRRNSLCSGKHVKWNITCIVFCSHECLYGFLHLRSTVSCQMSTLYCGGG